MQLTLQSSQGDVVKLKVEGKIRQQRISADSEPIKQEIGNDAYSRRILLDMAGAEYIDSSGISWLLVCHKRCAEAGGRFVLHSVPAIVMNVLMIVQLDKVFEIAESESAAEQMSSKPRPAAEEPAAKPEYPETAAEDAEGDGGDAS